LHGGAASAAISFGTGATRWGGEIAAAGGFDSPDIAAGFDSSDGEGGFDPSPSGAAATCVAAPAAGDGFAPGAVRDVPMSATTRAGSCGSAVARRKTAKRAGDNQNRFEMPSTLASQTLASYGRRRGSARDRRREDRLRCSTVGENRSARRTDVLFPQVQRLEQIAGFEQVNGLAWTACSGSQR
jgi:hypothetical protein